VVRGLSRKGEGETKKLAVRQKPKNNRYRLNGQAFVAVESIADYCMVSRSTVGRWIRDGELRAMKLPSGRCRISWVNLRDFLKKYNMPVPDEQLDS